MFAINPRSGDRAANVVVRNKPWRYNGFLTPFVITGVAICGLFVSACLSSGRSLGAGRAIARGAAQTVRDYQVLLTPSLRDGTAGWCLTAIAPRARFCAVPETFRGPVFVETENCSSGKGPIEAYALVARQTASVSVVAGEPVPTRHEEALPQGLRAVFVEVAYTWHKTGNCPHFTPLNGKYAPISDRRIPMGPLARQLPGIVRWKRTASQQAMDHSISLPSGVCEVGPSEAAGLEAREDVVMRRLFTVSTPVQPSYVSCASVDYFSRRGGRVRAAVLLDGEHLGKTPPSLPGMKPVFGKEGIVELQGAEGIVFGRRLRDAWLVVESIGAARTEALQLLTSIKARIH